MLDIVVASFLQGVLEWLPVSSEGMVTLFLGFLGHQFHDGIDFSLFLHLGTLLASLSFFSKEIWSFLKFENKKLLFFVLISGVITSIIGLPIYLFLQTINLDNRTGQLFIGIALLVTGFLQWKRKESGDKKINEVSNKDSFLTGVAQALAVFPGISRSGVTTIMLNFRGFDIEKSLRLSFLASIIPIFGAQLVTGLKEGFFFKKEYLLGVLISFIVGRFTIAYLLKVAKKINFGTFCFVFGVFNIMLIFFL